MTHLTVSQMAIFPSLDTKWGHDAVNGITNGYHWLAERRIRRRVTRLLHKSGVSIGEPGQWTSDQVRVPGLWFLVSGWSE